MALNPRITDWTGRRVWILGASAGIGAALARELLRRGARVAGTARNAEALARVLGGSPETLALPGDVTRPETIAAARDRIVAAWGGIDVAVFMAGTYSAARAWEVPVEGARQEVEINLMGAFNGVATLLPQLLQQGRGALVLVSSVAGYRGLPNSLVYGATKSALINMAETLYLDLAPRGVAVYLVNPGFVRTPLTDRNTFRMPALIEADEAARRIADGMEAGRFEIHFPRRFTGWLKLLEVLPYRWYFAAVRRFTGL
ncbi:MAG: SDR family NAD(P)-dependent oxidoreductase [Pseudomonadota bacterium]